ncbi:hypothetical protein MNBD_GAMMA06-806 [hydrothermal vent metagenome]|uniref:Uncharacterized protein n=1 Tax=hydrothermal vent metagenome TaxID=652676 RepID=A0A3B0WQK0_9ZZZZ
MIDNAVANPHEDLNVRRMFQEIEHSIKALNHEKISEITGDISKQAFINVASTTARLRARYLAKVIELESTDDIKPADISTLRGSRLMYEEALEGFSALHHALGRGYFSLADEK